MSGIGRIDLGPTPRILVIALLRLGDVLLATPLIHSLRHAWPEATIDALVFADTAGILTDNPDLSGVVTMPPRSTALQSLALAARLWKRYDLAISTQLGDRPSFFVIVLEAIGVLNRLHSGSRKAFRENPQQPGRRGARLSSPQSARHWKRRLKWQRLVHGNVHHHETEGIGHGKAHCREDGGSFIFDTLIDTSANNIGELGHPRSTAIMRDRWRSEYGGIKGSLLQSRSEGI
jgi:hypothetical protein